MGIVVIVWMIQALNEVHILLPCTHALMQMLVSSRTVNPCDTVCAHHRSTTILTATGARSATPTATSTRRAPDARPGTARFLMVSRVTTTGTRTASATRTTQTTPPNG
jgi:hypothetical protein